MAVSRFEAEQGDTVRLRVRIEKNDVLFDPFDFGDVEIRRRTSATTDMLVTTIPEASIVRESVGIYYVDWAIPLTEPVGAHVDRWFFTGVSGGTEISRDAEFTVFAQGSLTAVSGYLTVTETRDVYLPSGSGLTDAQVAALIEVASDIAERYTGRHFGGRAKTLVEDGTGQAWIVMDEMVQSISAIAVRSGGTTYTLDPSDFVIRGRWVIHKDYAPGDWAGCASLCGCAFGDIFARGEQNVTMDGVFGDFADVPATLKRAVGLLVKYGGQDETTSAPMAFNFSSESVEGHSYSLRDVVQNINIRGSTGIPEVDHLLNLLRKVRGRVAVF